jgi:hypothetical protein
VGVVTPCYADIIMRLTSRGSVVVGCCLALAVAACQQPQPQQAEQPKRKSFEESDSNFTPISASSSDSSPASGNTGSSPQAINDGWKAAANAQGDAAKQQAAGQMLNKTREMADQSNKPPQ